MLQPTSNSHAYYSALEAVNIFQGTDSTFDFSTGNTYPAMAMPWGMTFWSLQTQQNKWFYHHQHPKCQGLRATHQPSPWIGDYGPMVMMPVSGTPCLSPETWSSAYQWDQQQTGPGGGRIELKRYQIEIQWAVTQRGCIAQSKYHRKEQPGMLIYLPDGTGKIQIQPQQRRILCCTHANHGGTPCNFGCYYIIEFDCDIQAFGIERGRQLVLSESCVEGENACIYVQFKQSNTQTVTSRVASSFINHDQALLNLKRELLPYTIDHVRKEVDQTWQKLLDRISIQTDDPTIYQTFYTALYRCLLFPRGLYELDEHGNEYHYSPYDGQIHPGKIYTDQGFWDVHRTLYPLLSIAYPCAYRDILTGWLNAYREGGWLPKWASPGYRNAMCGTHAEAVFADAIIKDIDDFDHELAYKAIVQSASEVGDAAGTRGRNGLEHYLKLGYVPADKVIHSVSETMDFAYCDFTISQAAKKLGKTKDAKYFAQRGQNYKHLFDPTIGYFRGKNSDGSWVEDFDPTAWGGPYVEGCANHFLWAVPHDPAGLAKLLGGNKIMCQRLEAMLLDEARFEIGGYEYEIHEMTEMASADFGQYAHCNQPVHHALYLFSEIGAPAQTRHWVQRVLRELYTPNHLPGDEDNGEMSAWYVLSAIGLYPTCLASGSYALGSPLIKQINIKTDNGKYFEIQGHADSLQLVDHCQIRLNNESYEHMTIPHHMIASGGKLVFSPSKDAVAISSQRI
jgi:predicted alpha-1,2-mannosidase